MASKRRSAASGPQAAYVLHTYDWSETSLIVELFTRGLGRVVTVAKGAKRPTSNFRAVLLQFQRLSIQLGSASGDEGSEVHNLRAAEWAGGEPTAAGAALFAAFYLNELVLRFLPRQDPHAGLFDAYAQALASLCADDDPANQCTLRIFELLLLRELGWVPELQRVTATQQLLLPQASYALHPEAGLVSAASGIPGSCWQAMDGALSSTDVDGLRRVLQPWRVAIRTQLRELLHYHLGSSALRTRQVRDGALRLLPPAAGQPLLTPR